MISLCHVEKCQAEPLSALWILISSTSHLIKFYQMLSYFFNFFPVNFIRTLYIVIKSILFSYFNTLPVIKGFYGKWQSLMDEQLAFNFSPNIWLVHFVNKCLAWFGNSAPTAKQTDIMFIINITFAQLQIQSFVSWILIDFGHHFHMHCINSIVTLESKLEFYVPFNSLGHMGQVLGIAVTVTSWPRTFCHPWEAPHERNLLFFHVKSIDVPCAIFIIYFSWEIHTDLHKTTTNNDFLLQLSWITTGNSDYWTSMDH